MPGEDKEGSKPSFRINFNPDQLRKFLRQEDKKDMDLFPEVAKHSRDYMDAFGLESRDVEVLEKKQEKKGGMYPEAGDLYDGSLIKLEIEGKKFGIFAANVCGQEYGNNWQDMLMAVSNDASLNKMVGRGTTLIISVSEEWHTKILQAVKQSSQQDNLSGELFNFLGTK